MEIRRIKNNYDYQEALREIDRLMDAPSSRIKIRPERHVRDRFIVLPQSTCYAAA